MELFEGADRMMRVMRHRLLNIVSGVKSANNLLQNMLEDRLTPQEREYFPLINKECNLVCALVERFELFFGPPPERAPAPLAAAVARATEALEATFPLAEFYFELDLPAADGPTICSNTLVTALLEAADNAYGITRGPVWIAVAATENGCVARVADAGEPLSEEAMAEAFIPFQTGRTKHLGLGLPIARRGVEQFGGGASMRREKERNVVEFVLPGVDAVMAGGE